MRTYIAHVDVRQYRENGTQCFGLHVFVNTEAENEEKAYDKIMAYYQKVYGSHFKASVEVAMFTFIE